MDAPQVPNAPESLIGQITAGIIFALFVLSGISAAVMRFFHKRKEAHPDDVKRSDTIELIDSTHIRNDLHVIADRLTGIEATQTEIVSDLLHLKNREEAARMAREEVARLLAEERNRQGR